jgi:hypothetical protein
MTMRATGELLAVCGDCGTEALFVVTEPPTCPTCGSTNLLAPDGPDEPNEIEGPVLPGLTDSAYLGAWRNES